MLASLFRQPLTHLSEKLKYNLFAALTGLALASTPLGASAATGVYQELILSLDVSGSIDVNEYNLQRNGWFNAFSDPAIKAKLFSPAVLSAGGTAIGVAQWSSAGEQTMAIPTMAIFDDTSYANFLSQLNTMPRIYNGATCVSCGINVAINDIVNNGFTTPAGEPNRMVIDLSGDGFNNDGGDPLAEKAEAERLGIVINALAIEDSRLVPYFESNVATMATAINGGTKAGFVDLATSFVEFDKAALAKLAKEMAPPPRSTSVPAGLPILGAGAAFGSIRKMRHLSSQLQGYPKA
jgi:hypothetical protein